MTQTRQAMVNRSFSTSVGYGSIDLLSCAQSAVKQVLRPTKSVQKTGLCGEVEVADNHPDSLRDDTWSPSVETPVISLPPSTIPSSRMAMLHALQEWEGYVVDIEEDVFVARLVDLTAGMRYESEEAIIPLEELSESDIDKMVVGSIFRWVIGYECSPEGTRKRVSQIVFRDLPRMTEDELQSGREWASRMASALNP